ncbi:unnamed protein product [Amoebophrya sp. A120]|nr:unnamed protein product [Amoebophrya sp. A120]|eukprot:GSA120T00012561001.1
MGAVCCAEERKPDASMTKSKKAGAGDGYPQALGTATSKKKLGQGADGLTSAKLNRNMTTPEERGFQSGWYRSSAADPMMQQGTKAGTALKKMETTNVERGFAEDWMDRGPSAFQDPAMKYEEKSRGFDSGWYRGSYNPKL